MSESVKVRLRLEGHLDMVGKAATLAAERRYPMVRGDFVGRLQAEMIRAAHRQGSGEGDSGL